MSTGGAAREQGRASREHKAAQREQWGAAREQMFSSSSWEEALHQGSLIWLPCSARAAHVMYDIL